MVVDKQVSAAAAGGAPPVLPSGEQATQWSALVDGALARPPSAAVLSVLDEQQRRLPPSAAREAHLAALREGAALVVTGQQVGLFLGPLYTIYKAATAVRLAQQLTQETGHPCAPLFWLQTEDHDRAEVDHCFLPGADGGPPKRVALADDGLPAGVPLAHRRLGDSVLPCLDALEHAVEGLPHAAATVELFRSAYQPERTFAQAFSEVLATFFAADGLLVLDPRDGRLQREAAPLYRHCLERASELSTLLQRQSAALASAGAPTPVHVRPGSPLFFFHPQGGEGPRYRLDPLGGLDPLDGHREAADRFALVGGSGEVTRAAVAAQLEQEPLAFSSSALLRPLLQDSLLPTVALVGGPSELSYLAQLPPLYAALGVTAARPLRRHGFYLLDQPLRRTLARLGLEAKTLVEADEATIEGLLARRAAGDDELTPEALETKLLVELEAGLDAFEPHARALDAALEAGVEKTRQSVRRSVGRLVGRYQRTLAQRDDVARARLARARTALCPLGTPQERVLSLPYFLAAHGAEALRSRLLEAISEPAAGHTLELEL